MCGKTGYEVCDEIKKTEGTKDIFVLMLSARTGPTSSRVAAVKGANDFMEKPFSPKVLRDKVKKILNI